VTHLVVREYAWLYRGTHARLLSPDHTRAELPAPAFDALRALLEFSDEVPPDHAGVLTYGLEGGREVLRASSWVGVLETPDGTQLEILPKLLEDEMDVVRTRALLVRMIAALPDAPYREVDVADLEAAQLPLTEVFAGLFLRAVARLIRQGVAYTYRERELELPALRGRLDLPRHLLGRASRPAALHVIADEFVPDRPENRAIRAALDRVRVRLTTTENLRLHAELTFAFADVLPGRAPLDDLKAWRLDRSHRHYAPLRPLVELVLTGRTPLTAQGQVGVPALLFPMPVVFEAYVASCLRAQRTLDGQPRWTRVETQVGGQHLVTQGNRTLFALRPDLRLTGREGQVIIADTKWKRLNRALGAQAGLGMGDLYQLFAYGHKHLNGTGEVWLIYPRTKAFQFPLPDFSYGPGLTLRVLPFDVEAGLLMVGSEVA
jgi:5-methylcytosine-specific restriction enzyme subunit McrC